MKPMNYFLLLSMVALAACSGTGRPVYSGHQESTEGVPGFKNGKKQSRYVKLGQSYTVDGETHVPRYQPGYVEEGMASWYGPGFHGGKTANGEVFDKHDMTAAHRTLPLPSMVKVTMLETGRSVIVRVNDRGPFSKGRIIDLSRGAAEKIGLLGKGVAKVRVEYLDQESKRFATLLAEGRDPNDINIDSEILGAGSNMYASNSAKPAGSWWNRLNPIGTAHAEEAPSYDLATNSAADTMSVTSTDLAAPAGAAPAPVPQSAIPNASSPFAGVEPAPMAPEPQVATQAPAPVVTSPAVPVTIGHYLQLGAFSQQVNAERLRDKVMTIGAASIEPKNVAGTNLFVVKMGPYSDVEESSRVLAQLNGLGINPQTVSK